MRIRATGLCKMTRSGYQMYVWPQRAGVDQFVLWIAIMHCASGMCSICIVRDV